MFSPELASLEIKPDGQPVKLDIAQVVATTGEDVYMAMSESGLAVSVGDGMEQKLSSMLSAAALDPSPFSAFEVDAARYYNFIGATMGVPPYGENPTPPEVEKAMREILGVLEKTFERIYLNINFTEQGIEVSSKVTLAD
jgi:hypothetical protein